MKNQTGSVLVEFSVFFLMVGTVLYFSWHKVLYPQRKKLDQIFNQRLSYDGEVRWNP